MKEVLFISTRKAQTWYLDLIIALVIFSAALIIYLRVYGDLNDIQDERLDELTYDANVIADSLLSPGYPADWTQIDVERIGLLTDGSLDLNKHAMFNNTDLSTGRFIFGTRFDYLVYFKDKESHVLYLDTCAVGSSEVVVTNYTEFFCNNVSTSTISSDHLVKTERLVPYNGDFISMVVLLWERKVTS